MLAPASSLDLHAATDRDGASGEILILDDVANGVGNLIGFGEPTQWDQLFQLFQDRLRDRLAHFGIDETGRDGTDSDANSRPVLV